MMGSISRKLLPVLLAAGVMSLAAGCTNQDFSPANGTTVSEADSVTPSVTQGAEKKASPAKINPLEGDSSLTSSAEADESTASPDQESDQAAYHGTTNSGVNLHSSPKGPTVGSLPKNADVDVIAKDGSWYEIRYQDLTGYIYGRYLTLDNGDNGLEAKIEDFNSGGTDETENTDNTEDTDDNGNTDTTDNGDTDDTGNGTGGSGRSGNTGRASERNLLNTGNE